MNDIVQVFDFAVDLVCMMPPLDAIEAAGVSRELCMTATIGALFVLMVALISASMKDALGTGGIGAIVVGVCIALIGFQGMKPTLLRGIVATAYPPLVIALRFGEGAILGAHYRSAKWWWRLFALLPLIAALYVAANSVATDTLRAAKGIWFVVGAAVASYGWTTIVCGEGNPLFDSPISKVAIFVVLASTVLYVQSPPFERMLFQWMLPTGAIIGFVGGMRYGSVAKAHAQQTGGGDAEDRAPHP
jgi:hypothetical protein